MKKLAKIFAVAMVCVLALTALVACGPNTNYDKAKENLKKNKYTLTIATKEGDTGFAIAAAAAAPINGIKAEDIEAIISASNSDGEHVYIIWCKSSDAANTAYDKANEQKKALKENLDKMKDQMKDLDDEDKEFAQKQYDEMKQIYDNYVCGRSGKVVWSGTKEGIKATK